jgi:hypothetical protein
MPVFGLNVAIVDFPAIFSLLTTYLVARVGIHGLSDRQTIFAILRLAILRYPLYGEWFPADGSEGWRVRDENLVFG